jgi:transcriptional regulator with XRE-family HTH domain
MNAGARVLKVAKDRGVSQTEIAHRLGLNPSAVSLWGKEGRNPAIKHLPEIAKILGVSAEYLMTGEGEVSISETVSTPEGSPKESTSVSVDAGILEILKSQQRTIEALSRSVDRLTDGD